MRLTMRRNFSALDVVVGGLVTRPIKIVILPMIYEWVESRAAARAVRKAPKTDESTS